MLKIIHTNTEGRISIVTPARNSESDDGLSDEDIEKRAWDKLPNGVTDAVYVDNNDIPNSILYRDAWIIESGEIKTDISRAKDVHKERLRLDRAPLLSALDYQYLIADEAGDTVGKTQVAAQKNKLRNITSHTLINSAQTEDDLTPLTIPYLLSL